MRKCEEEQPERQLAVHYAFPKDCLNMGAAALLTQYILNWPEIVLVQSRNV
jgi:hypothetical protein